MTHHFDGERYVGEHLGVKYTLPLDWNAQDPRDDSDGWLGIMACEHRRYDLGDKDGTDALCDEIRNSKYYRDCWEDEDSRFYKGNASEPSGISKILPYCKDIVFLPLYLYDHSGITMSTGAFSCPWDSGQVGFIFTTLANSREALGKRTTPSKIRDILRAEVKEYDYYLTGNVFGFMVGEHVVYGFYGNDVAAAAAEDHINSLSEADRAALIAKQLVEADDDDA